MWVSTRSKTITTQRDVKCNACCKLCKSKLRFKHVHSAGWVREHADRCEFLGVSLVSNACICKACNTAILRGTRLLMDDKLPQQYKPRWCKRVESSNCCIPGCTVDARVMNHPYSWDAIRELAFGSAFHRSSTAIHSHCAWPTTFREYKTMR